ncbi:MAG TPA: hypothetical protein VKZ53_22275 [Candidatus Angelobacter sp.]|nr:hypothetical protein [Candidatus Angelobacter sp.]
MKNTFLVGMFLLRCMIGFAQPTPVAHSAPLSEVKGNVMGMPYSQYKQKHPADCQFDHESCIGSTTIAGVAADTSAIFFHGRLMSLSYRIAGWEDPQVLEDLKRKYGPPTESTSKIVKWHDDTTTLTFSRFSRYTEIDFLCDELWKQHVSANSALKSKMRKNDL